MFRHICYCYTRTKKKLHEAIVSFNTLLFFTYLDRLNKEGNYPDVSFSLCRLGAVMCMGVTAGAYILTRFAVRSLLAQCTIVLICVINFSNKSFMDLLIYP